MRRIGSRTVSWVVAVAITAFMSPVSFAAAPIGPNTVNSAAIIAADGASGQTLTTGSGVKTGHIQDGAVTASKLGMVCPTGNYLQYVFGSGWVCSVGTAGPQGPQGPIGAAGLAGATGPVGPIGMTGATGQTGPQGPAGLTGTQGLTGATGPEGPVGPIGATGSTGPQGSAGTTPHYANIIVVAKSGGDFTDPLAAINSIADASPTNQYLIKIMPGTYEISSFNTKESVDIEGSGQGTTVISNPNVVGVDSTFNIYSSSNIRNLSLYTPVSTRGSNPRLSDLTIISSHPEMMTNVAVNNWSPGLVLERVTIQSDGYGLRNNSGGNTSINNSNISSVNNWSGDAFHGTLAPAYVTIINSTIGNLFNNNSNYIDSYPATVKIYSSILGQVTNWDGYMYISNTQIQPEYYSNSGVVKCFSTYDQNFNPFTYN